MHFPVWLGISTDISFITYSWPDTWSPCTNRLNCLSVSILYCETSSALSHSLWLMLHCFYSFWISQLHFYCDSQCVHLHHNVGSAPYNIKWRWSSSYWTIRQDKLSGNLLHIVALCPLFPSFVIINFCMVFTHRLLLLLACPLVLCVHFSSMWLWKKHLWYQLLEDVPALKMVQIVQMVWMVLQRSLSPLIQSLPRKLLKNICVP